MSRLAVILGLLALACVLNWMAWGALRNLFFEYQDSPAWVYIGLGAFWLTLAAGSVLGAVWLWRGRRARGESRTSAR